MLRGVGVSRGMIILMLLATGQTRLNHSEDGYQCAARCDMSSKM